MRKILFLTLPLFVFLMAGVFAQTYYVGNAQFNLPHISVQGIYPSDSTHHTYFACLSSLDGDSNVISMTSSDKCEVSRIFNPTVTELGNHTYVTSIKYISRTWTQENGWQTTNEGIDNSNTLNFNVANIPQDDFSLSSWVSGILQNIQTFFCDHFGLFCSNNNSNSGCQVDSDCAGILPHKCEMNQIRCIQNSCVEVGPVCP